MSSETAPKDVNKILEIISRLEERVARIEDYLEIRPVSEASSDDGLTHPESRVYNEKESLEVKIGEYWLAHVGSVVLLMGIAFLISYPFRTLPTILTSLIGYLAVSGIFILSHYWQKTYQHLSKILFSGGFVLLYFATLRLHFFGNNQLLTSKTTGLVAIMAVLALILYLAIKRKSELLTGLTLFLFYATSLISDTTHFSLIFLSLSSFIAVFLLVRFNWQNLLIFSLVLTYLGHLLWLLNNPVLGKPMQALSEHHNSLLYLSIYGGLFASANLYREKASFSEFFEILLATLNGLGFYILCTLTVLTYFKPQLSLMNLAIAIFCIIMAILYWRRHQSRYSTAIYACFGYMVLSIAIFIQFKSPDYFIWLGWQSLLVISTAIMFRSRIIIVVNCLIYLGIFLAYLRLAPSNDIVNLSYAIAALTSARILNWKKERLELKTDIIRIAYLSTGFVIVLYGLNNVVPANYVSLAWLVAALFYFALSLALKNIKYRWMAILTIFALVFRVIFIDMARLSAEFRILLFLAVGFVLLAVSLLYSRFRKKISQN